MKKIKAYVLGLLLAVTMISVSACGNSNKTNESQSSSGGSTNQTTATQTTTATETSSSSSESNGAMDDEESTGVIDGVINDVEKGVNDVTGNTSGAETTQASDR